MSKTICEPIKMKVDSLTQLYHLIDALISNYDIYVKRVKGKNNITCGETARFEILIYERKEEE